MGTDLCRIGNSYGHATTIDVLPNDVLLDIFDSCRKGYHPYQSPFTSVWRWDGLVHVCQRWRQIVFGSPRRLDLQLLCTNGTPVRENLDLWPPFPIAIQYSSHKTFTHYDTDGLFAALEHPGRIRRVDLGLTGPQLTEAATVMQEPFPALTHLVIRRKDESPPAFPSGFLGGSAPCLQYMHLEGILFLALPSLLSSTSNLVDLRLLEDSYLSPEAMAACLATLPRLKSLFIGSQAATSHADRIRLPPETRTLLPALTSFKFRGDGKYLEELVSLIDSPELKHIYIRYSHQLFDFQVTQLYKFIDRSEDPKTTLIRHAHVNLSSYWVIFKFKMYPFPESRRDRGRVNALVFGQAIERQVSHIAQLFSQPSAILSRVVHLKLSLDLDIADRHDDEWLHLLHPFSAIRTLHVSGKFAGHFALSLEGVNGEMVAEVLPVLDLIYLDGQPVSSVEKFLAARWLSAHPVTVVDTEVGFYERVKSYVSE